MKPQVSDVLIALKEELDHAASNGHTMMPGQGIPHAEPGVRASDLESLIERFGGRP